MSAVENHYLMIECGKTRKSLKVVNQDPGENGITQVTIKDVVYTLFPNAAAAYAHSLTGYNGLVPKSLKPGDRYLQGTAFFATDKGLHKTGRIVQFFIGTIDKIALKSGRSLDKKQPASAPVASQAAPAKSAECVTFDPSNHGLFLDGQLLKTLEFGDDNNPDTYHLVKIERSYNPEQYSEAGRKVYGPLLIVDTKTLYYYANTDTNCAFVASGLLRQGNKVSIHRTDHNDHYSNKAMSLAKFGQRIGGTTPDLNLGLCVVATPAPKRPTAASPDLVGDKTVPFSSPGATLG